MPPENLHIRLQTLNLFKIWWIMRDELHQSENAKDMPKPSRTRDRVQLLFRFPKR